MVSVAQLTLAQWLSPAFPTGAFAYSHGLEQVVAEDAVTDATEFEKWLGEILRFGTGWQDAVLLAQGLAPGADFDRLDAMALALQPAAERLSESAEQGAAFARTVAATTGRRLAPRMLPIAVAEAAKPLDLGRAEVVAAFLHSFTTNLVTIAIRHVPLGQSDGHAVLSRLLPVIAELAEAAETATLDDLSNTCFRADLAAIHHETKDVRVFRT